MWWNSFKKCKLLWYWFQGKDDILVITLIIQDTLSALRLLSSVIISLIIWNQAAAPEGVTYDKKDVLQGFCLLLDGQASHQWHHYNYDQSSQKIQIILSKFFTGRRLQCPSSWGLCVVNLGHWCRSNKYISSRTKGQRIFGWIVN